MNMLLFVVLFTLGVSGLCSLLEAALYSARVPTLEAAKAQGRHRASAERFLRMKRDIAAPTSAILILNTIAHTAGATVAGWLAARSLGEAMVPAFSVVFTLAILFLSEILPKTYGANAWKSLWPFLALPLDWLVIALRPAVWVSRKFAELFSSDPATHAVTEDEVRATIQMGARAGELSKDELQLLNAVFHFDETRVREILVPRHEVVWVDLDKPKEFARIASEEPFTRYPACRGDLDHVEGVLHAKDFAGLNLDQQTDLTPIVRDVLEVPETLSITRLLRLMQSRRRQIAVVIDEHGTVTGIVTLIDVLEQIVGALDDEFEETEDAIVKKGEGSYVVRGDVSLERVNREVGLDLYDPSVVTLSGFLINELGRFAKKGDVVEREGFRAEVLEANRRRATLVALRLNDGASPEETPGSGGS